ncbi:Zn-ribbon domain-containing OB-fold protein [Actinophytocola sp. NPDC049390]|uniref:Zn-ribbon domain-containing OB-fold protein n=1 Tax=Actinophytocola sp. NPDC049390 TaxID=3363894 RepID=UPI0037896E5A
MDVQPVVGEPDPRVRVVESAEGLAVVGWRCAGCGLAVVEPSLRCGDCGARVDQVSLRPNGIVWSWTAMGVGPDRGTAFAYVDLDDGPRVLVRLDGDAPRAVGTRVRVRAVTPGGDLEAGA